MRPASSFREQRRRRRREVFKRFLWIAAGIGLLVVASLSGYEVGISKSRHEVQLLRAEIDTLNNNLYALEIRTGEAMQQAGTATARWQDLQRRYRDDVPVGALKELLVTLEQKIQSAVPVDRIRFVIDQLGRERNCKEKTETKRFMLRTPVTAGPIENVSLVNNTIVLSGEGEAMRNQSGLAEAWFDPSQEVQIRFLRINGEISLAGGLLPLSHSIVVGDQEHIFLIKSNDSRGFVEATAQTCDYP